MKKQILNGSGQRFKTRLLLLCISIILFSAACKKELYDSSITPPSQKDPFLTELYHNLLKNDAQYHILDQLQPTDRLGWERMMVRYKGGKAAPFNYVMPVIRQGSTTDRLIQFSFSRDHKLVNISLLSYNNNLRLPIASDSLNSSYVKNEQTGNILACMSKNGLAVSDKLSIRASSISPSDMHKVATPENLKQAKPQALMSLPNKAAAKPIGTNAKIMMGFNDGSGCSITVDFEFLFTYSTYYSIDEDNVFNYAHPNNNNGISYDRTAADDLDRFFTEYLNNSEYDYEDRSNAFQNQIVFFGVGPAFTSPVTSRVYDALQYATQQTAFSQGFDMYTINYFFPRTSSTCLVYGGGTPSDENSEPPLQVPIDPNTVNLPQNKLCSTSFVFSTVVNPDPSQGSRGWKEAAVSGITINVLPDNYLDNIWDVLTTGSVFLSGNFNLTVGVPGDLPNAIVAKEAALAANITMVQIEKSYGTAGLETLIRNGTLGIQVAKLMQIQLRLAIPGSTVGNNLGGSTTPHTPVTGTNCQ